MKNTKTIALVAAVMIALIHLFGSSLLVNASTTQLAQLGGVASATTVVPANDETEDADALPQPTAPGEVDDADALPQPTAPGQAGDEDTLPQPAAPGEPGEEDALPQPAAPGESVNHAPLNALFMPMISNR